MHTNISFIGSGRVLFEVGEGRAKCKDFTVGAYPHTPLDSLRCIVKLGIFLRIIQRGGRLFRAANTIY